MILVFEEIYVSPVYCLFEYPIREKKREYRLKEVDVWGIPVNTLAPFNQLFKFDLLSFFLLLSSFLLTFCLLVSRLLWMKLSV